MRPPSCSKEVEGPRRTRGGPLMQVVQRGLGDHAAPVDGVPGTEGGEWACLVGAWRS